MPDDDLKKTASDAADSVKQAAAGAADAVNTAEEQARDYAERGMEYASDYSGRLAEFVQRKPWMAMAGAFIVGYAAAKLLRSVSAPRARSLRRLAAHLFGAWGKR